MLGFFVVALDAQVVNVALPDIRTGQRGDLAGLQWVVTIYTLMFSVLLLFARTLSDRVGAHQAYAAGMVLFLLALAACGLAATLPVLIGARFTSPTPRRTQGKRGSAHRKNHGANGLPTRRGETSKTRRHMGYGSNHAALISEMRWHAEDDGDARRSSHNPKTADNAVRPHRPAAPTSTWPPAE
jgi:hypothetical protein